MDRILESKLLDLTVQSLRLWTDLRYIARGRSYLSHVGEPKWTADGELVAKVRGTHVYTTRLFLDENGEPIKAGDEDRRFFEGPWMHKHHGKYYLSYSTGTTHYLCYAEGDLPEGPFTYKGRIMEPVLGWTTHHSIVEIEGDWYLFYHDSELSGGVNHERCVKYTKLDIAEDGTITTIHPYDHLEK